MSKRLASWLCIPCMISHLIGFNAAALAQGVQSDSSGTSPASVPAGTDTPNANSQPSTNQSSSAQGNDASTSPAATTSPGATSGTPNAQASDTKPKEGEAQTSAKEPEKSKQVKSDHRIVPHSAAAVQKVSPVASSKPLVLYGRIEQLAAGTSAQFPIVLQPMKAKMDPRGVPLKASASEAALRGSVVTSFPTDFSGTWGGSLAVWTMQQSALCWQVDPDEAKWTQAAMRQGLVGQTNFIFGRDGSNKTALEPAKILFSVPMKDTNQQEQIDQLMKSGTLGGQSSNPAMGDFMRQFVGSMANSLNVPMVMSLGNMQSGGLAHGVSGNELQERVVKNVLRELAPGVLEQQIITSESERIAKTGQVRYGYGESVIRLTKQNADQLYAQVATVNYFENRQFRRKIILYGVLRRGQVMNTTPDPMAGLGNMMNVPGATGGQNPSLPQMPGGQNPYDALKNLQNLQNLFPH
jgi:hypothetical protein